MKKNLLVAFGPAIALVATLIPVAAFASTYDYVTTAGTVQTVSADNASDALATAPNIAPNSGVALEAGATISTTVPNGDPVYEYVMTNGSIGTITADNSTDALATAPNIAPNSGVMVI